MDKISKLNIGIAGVGGRPHAFISAIENSNKARLAAVCDINTDAMDAAVDGQKDVLKFSDYEEMIGKANLDAVIIGTPMDLHVQQSIAALNNNIHVYSEVTAGISIEQCRELVAACNRSKARYMLGENCNYMKSYMILKEMIKAGVFGDVYYAEGEYLHNCREMAQTSEWRKKWVYGIDGITYGTHSIGPILSWFEGDRIVKVSCTGSGWHYRDEKNGKYMQEDTCVMMGKTKSDRLVKIRMDIISNRSYNLRYILQGTNGCFESARCKDEKDKVWIKDICKEEEWIEIESLVDKYLPEIWKKHGTNDESILHGGSDYIIMTEFIEAIADNRPIPLGVHEAMDMTIPGIVSQESIKCNGIWLDVPDSREWKSICKDNDNIGGLSNEK